MSFKCTHGIDAQDCWALTKLPSVLFVGVSREVLWEVLISLYLYLCITCSTKAISDPRSWLRIEVCQRYASEGETRHTVEWQEGGRERIVEVSGESEWVSLRVQHTSEWRDQWGALVGLRSLESGSFGTETEKWINDKNKRYIGIITSSPFWRKGKQLFVFSVFAHSHFSYTQSETGTVHSWAMGTVSELCASSFQAFMCPTVLPAAPAGGSVNMCWRLCVCLWNTTISNVKSFVWCFVRRDISQICSSVMV